MNRSMFTGRRRIVRLDKVASSRVKASSVLKIRKPRAHAFSEIEGAIKLWLFRNWSRRSGLGAICSGGSIEQQRIVERSMPKMQVTRRDNTERWAMVRISALRNGMLR